MIRRDFILRLIEEFFLFLARALGTFQKKDIPQAEASIDLAYRRFLGLSADFAERASLDSLLTLFRVDPDRAGPQCLIAAELMRARGLIRREEGRDDEAERLLLRALDLYLAALPLPDPTEHADYRPGMRMALDSVGHLLSREKTAQLLALLDQPREERG